LCSARQRALFAHFGAGVVTLEAKELAMNTVFARALVAFILVVLPTSALASTKSEAKADKANHGHSHPPIAKKEAKTKKAKHHGHKAKDGKGVAASSAAKAR
jgi:hypothetical protein